MALLCSILKCSRSGYYAWVKSGRPKYKSFNKDISDLVFKVYSEDKRRGIVSIRMKIKKIYGLFLTNKTIYRYMKIHNIKSIIRPKRKRYSKVEHHNISNQIKRNFKACKPNEKWSIDITYIHTTQGVEYLCAIKDMYDKSIIAYKTSSKNNNPLVISTIKEAFAIVESKKRLNLILHSDQGHQFTSFVYSQVLKENNVTHSVSAKGSCVDNVPIESWFSALKTECIYLAGNFNRLEAQKLVKDYVHYYNNERQQEQLKELTPLEFRMLVLN
ncbi:IS3 family transposase [Sphaerochaeta sp. S2]|uniref:IS3 family transposase n=1 Tax=Sphaerochaeta sp. S2 TaxID=2798868 RepID=UPI00351C3190